MVAEICRKAKRFWESVYPRSLRVTERRLHQKNVVADHSRKPLKSRSRLSTGRQDYSIFSGNALKNRKVPIPGYRRVSKQFIEVLKNAIESDNALRAHVERFDRSRLEYRGILWWESQELGELERLQKTESSSKAREDEINARNYPKHCKHFRTKFNQEKDATSATTKVRRQSFCKLYKIAQDEISHEPKDGVEGLDQMPLEFFRVLQEALDCRQTANIRRDKVRVTLRRLIEIHKGLKDPEATRDEEGTNLDLQRRDAVLEYRYAKMETLLTDESIALKERDFIALARPQLAYQHMLPVLAAGVNRGAAHIPPNEAQMRDIIDGMPRNRQALKEGRKMVGEILDSANKRYETLAWQYCRDLEKFLESNPSARTQFDQQFFSDRNQALRDIGLVERTLKEILRIQRKLGWIELADITSNFGTVSGDGHVESESTGHLQERGTHNRLERPHVAEYIIKIADEDFTNPFSPKSTPDDQWEGDPIQPDDFESASIRESDPGRRRYLPR